MQMKFDKIVQNILEQNGPVKKEIKKIENVAKKIADNRMKKKHKAGKEFQQKMDVL